MLETIISTIQNSMLVNLFWALIIFFLGVFISSKIGQLVSEGLAKVKLNSVMKGLNWDGFFRKHNTKLNAEGFFGAVVKVFFILITLMICIEILNLDLVNEFLLQIVSYYPNIFIASVIFIIAAFVAEFSKKIVIASNTDKDSFKFSNSIGNVISICVWVLSILAILYQLQIVPNLILTIFIGVVFMIALIFGLAFGLGAVDTVKDYLKGVHKNTKK
jgi:hypothetical protein